MSELKLFQGKVDKYSAVIVSSKDEPVSASDFENILNASIIKWKKSGLKSIWFKVYLNDAHWVPILASQGFVFHHTKTEYVFMIKWIAENEENTIPSYAHNTIGVGALIVSEDDEILVVREKIDFTSSPPWKFPGGFLEPGEDLTDGIIREVKEETGIDADYKHLIAFRHIHDLYFKCSDIYFLMYLETKKRDVVMCKKELLDCRWMKIQEFLNHPNVTEANKLYVNCYLKDRDSRIHMKPVKTNSRIANKPQHIYHMHNSTK